jgi:hypothetical protein
MTTIRRITRAVLLFAFRLRPWTGARLRVCITGRYYPAVVVSIDRAHRQFDVVVIVRGRLDSAIEGHYQVTVDLADEAYEWEE